MPSPSKKVEGRISLLARVLIVVVCVAGASRSAWGTTPSGNEFALYFTEATTDAERQALLAKAVDQQHFFRYLRVEILEEGETNGYPYVFLSMIEPSSYMTIQCTVRKSLSLAKLKEEPVTKAGDAVAITGVIRSADISQRMIVVNPVIVRYKDRSAPKPGKEMLSEVDSSAVVYSFTGGKNPVNVSKRDEDLLQHEKEILSSQGKDAWSKFLLKEIAKRDKAALAERDKLNIYRKTSVSPDLDSGTNAPPPVTKDDE
jgi:hypothetical protein